MCGGYGFKGIRMIPQASADHQFMFHEIFFANSRACERLQL
jgi:hypothetical protein